jgi:hypothetical protein
MNEVQVDEDGNGHLLDERAPDHLSPAPPARMPVVQSQVQASGPMRLLEIAVQRGASVDELEKLMALAERHDSNEARKAFNVAKAAFNAEDINITKDKENKQFGSMYTTIGNLVNTVRPFLGKHGLSADWTFSQANGIEVTCILSHERGHSERVTLKVPADTSGAKNPLQQIKSSITYARSATFEAVCGLASSADSNLDDDGNDSGVITQQDKQDLRKEAARMRQRATPADVANRGKQEQPADSPEFLALRQSARMAADQGRDAFGAFWKELSGAKRNMIAPELEDLQARVDKAEAGKAA